MWLIVCLFVCLFASVGPCACLFDAWFAWLLGYVFACLIVCVCVFVVCLCLVVCLLF